MCPAACVREREEVCVGRREGKHIYFSKKHGIG